MTQPNYDSSITKAYADVLRDHVIVPLSGPIGESCFATSLLLFAGVDGLGKLVHPDENAGAGERFKAFLPRFCAGYVAVEKQLWALRNSLAHNVMSLACYMSKLEDSRAFHLEVEADLIFIHTRVMLDDFKRALAQLEEDFRRDNAPTGPSRLAPYVGNPK
jgi:hypothetical protein